MSRAWANGSTTRWRKLRITILNRDRWRCRIALPGTWVDSQGRQVQCLGRADSVHHTKGRAVTGDDPAYLIAACRPCNLKIGNPIKTDPRPMPRTQW